MKTTDPTDEELCVEVAAVLGRAPRSAGWYIKHPTEDAIVMQSSYRQECIDWLERRDAKSEYKHWIIVEDLRYPAWTTSADAALELVEAMEQRGFDVIIRRHNGGHWQCEFTEPSHEIERNAPTLPLAIVLAFLAAQGEGAL